MAWTDTLVLASGSSMQAPKPPPETASDTISPRPAGVAPRVSYPMSIVQDPTIAEGPVPSPDEELPRRSLRHWIAQSRWVRAAIGAGAGGALGLGYYALIGCSTGACPITSSPLTTTLYGALVGLIAASR